MRGDSGAPAIPNCRSLSLLGDRPACTLYAADSDAYGGAVTVTVYGRVSDDASRRRFDRAVATARRLGQHPHLVTIHASGRLDDGRLYVVSDGHERTTTHGLLATSGVLAVEPVLRMGIALAGALETAHRAGVVHGGVAPDLILLSAEGQPVLTEAGLTEFGQPAGISAALDRSIPYHAPPEVLESTDLSAATDVYSLASVIYTLLVGQPPHATCGVVDSTASLLLRILQMPMPTIQRSDVPPGLEDALRTALTHTPGKRQQQVLELAWALQDAQRLAGMEVTEPIVADLAVPGDSPAGPGAAPASSAAAPAGSAAAPAGPGVAHASFAAAPAGPETAPVPPPATPVPATEAGLPVAPVAPLLTPRAPLGPDRTPEASDDPTPAAPRGPAGSEVPAFPWPDDASVAATAGTAPDGTPWATLSDLAGRLAGSVDRAPVADARPAVLGSGGPGVAGVPIGGGFDPLPTSPAGGSSGAGDEPAAEPRPDWSWLADPAVPTPGVPAAHPGGADDRPWHPGAADDHHLSAAADWTGPAPDLGRAPATADWTPGPAPDLGRAPATADSPWRPGDGGGPPWAATTSMPGTGPSTGDIAGNGSGEEDEARPWWAAFGSTDTPPDSAGATTGLNGMSSAHGAGPAGDLAGADQARGAPDGTAAGEVPGESRSRRSHDRAHRREPRPARPVESGERSNASSALERARQARLERQRLEREGGTRPGFGSRIDGRAGASDGAASGGRSLTGIDVDTEPRPPAPGPGRPGVRAGPPALPVIVLLVVVVVLGLGGAYLVATGEDSAGPGSADRTATTPTSQATPASAPMATVPTPNPATAIRAVPLDGGLLLDWDGPDGPAYVLQLLTAGAAPRRLDAGPGTGLLVPAEVMAQIGADYCVDVAGVPPVEAPRLDPAVPLPTACVGAATPESVRRT
ncbi:MAG TPA: protein kinase [Acidimicrobiales bacterium]|nr:protein kinase [Acidimicrobiales bacterium]